MPTKVEKVIMNDGGRLSKALEVLMHDIVYASIYNKLIFDLIECRNTNNEVFNESNTFWYLVFESLKESRMIRLCRICDKETKSISIGNLLQAIKGCKNAFSKDEFRKRLKDNPFVESLSEYDREIDIDEIEIEMKKFENNLIVNKIRKWRNNYIAHKGITEGLVDFKILKENELTYQEISDFIEDSRKLINKYLHTLIAVSWSDKIIGNEDFNSLIRFASIGLNKYKEDLELEFKKYNKNE